jgi:hypothetical protein
MESLPFDALDKAVALLEVGDSLMALEVVVSMVLLVVLVQVGRLVVDCRSSIRAGKAHSGESVINGPYRENQK